MSTSHPPRGTLLDVEGAAAYLGTTTRHVRRLLDGVAGGERRRVEPLVIGPIRTL